MLALASVVLGDHPLGGGDHFHAHTQPSAAIGGLGFQRGGRQQQEFFGDSFGFSSR